MSTGPGVRFCIVQIWLRCIQAYKSQYYTMTEIGDYFGVSYSTVS